MPPRIYRYIFYRLNRFQEARLRDSVESALTANLLMCLPPYLFLDLLGRLIAAWLDVPTLHDMVGKWIYGLTLFGTLYAIHYHLLVGHGQATAIVKEFRDRSPYGHMGNWVVFAFFAIPMTLSFGAVVVSRSSGAG